MHNLIATLTKHKNLTFTILPLMYLAGFVGLQLSATRTLFEALIPFNLIASLCLLLWFHQDFNKSFIFYCLLAFFIGFGVEVLGVQTGLIFGYYHYGTLLGVGIWDVPFTIGCNWLMLNYCTNVIANRFKVSIVIKILIAASLMTALDFLIEPVAMQLGFWYWQNNHVPLQNYVAWFGVSALISTVYFLLYFDKKNPLAFLLFVLQVLFFGIFNFLL